MTPAKNAKKKTSTASGTKRSTRRTSTSSTTAKRSTGRTRRTSTATAPKRAARPKPAAKTTTAAAPKKAAPKRTRPKQSERTRLRARVQKGTKPLADVLRERPRAVRAMQIDELLQWQSGLGAAGARRVLRGVVFDPRTKVEDLSDHAIGRLVTKLARQPDERAATLREAA